MKVELFKTFIRPVMSIILFEAVQPKTQKEKLEDWYHR